MVAYATLRDVRPSQFEQAADGYHAVSSAASEAKDRLSNQIVAKKFPNPSPSGKGADGLVGHGAVEAAKRLTRLAKNFHYAQVECGLVSAALNGFAAELRVAQKKLTNAVQEAESAGFTVKENGSVNWVSEDTPLVSGRGVTAQDSWIPLADPDPKRVKAQAFADRIGDALADAAEADQKWAPKLERLKAQNDLTVSAKDWDNVHGDQSAVQKIASDYLAKGEIPTGKSPQENAAWWKDLNEQEKADYVSLYPASVGALDGLPTEVRDEANRAVLAEKKGHFQTELTTIPPEPMKYQPPTSGTRKEWRDWYRDHGARKEFMEKSLRGMEGIQQRFDRTGLDGTPEAYLLGFDARGEGDGKAIIANGNPDTADHTAVYVPGTGADLESIEGNLARSERLWRASQDRAPGMDISTITWLDYDTPRSAVPIMDGDVIPEATDPEYAQKAAPTINQFMSGVEEVQGGPDSSHTTIVGHSYGSTAIGEASKHGDLAADDIMVAGSPGMQTRHADDLDVESGHVWAMAAPFGSDQVPEGGRLVGLGDERTVPTDPEFGGNIMRTDSDSHSGYWDVDKNGDPKISLRNQASVIIGEYEEVKLE